MGKDNGSSAKETPGGTYINVNSNDNKGHVNIYDRDPRGNHDSIHINVDYNTGKGSITEKDGDSKTTKDTSCYLTSACMKHFQETFDDSCYELRVLRWFRDTFVSQEDIAHYYQTAPVIVAAIDKYGEGANTAYDYIYENVVRVCVEAIENGNYNFAYERYKSSILALEEQFARKEYQSRLVKAIKTPALRTV
ncbi:MAG: hypothetical protein PHU45_04855 [Bacilli bacterium]|nr:hypothetical protein [Bacilli bacterium]